MTKLQIFFIALNRTQALNEWWTWLHQEEHLTFITNNLTATDRIQNLIGQSLGDEKIKSYENRPQNRNIFSLNNN